MKTKLYDYYLPPELIASKPLENRISSRLLIDQDKIIDTTFDHIIDYLNKGDLLVLNNTEVLKARLFTVKKDTGGKIEILVLTLPDDNNNIYALVKKIKTVHIGTTLIVSDDFSLICVEKEEDGIGKFKVETDNFLDKLNQYGVVPLPPYIGKQRIELERYQTVYASVPGSVAAPTAGLHFTPELLNKIKEKGVEIATVTLHVGIDTFRPIKSENITDHKMHSEYIELNLECANLLNMTRARNKRIIAVGTTSVRVLESVYRKFNGFFPYCGKTSLFLYPPQTVASIDGLITNFHLPLSSLLLLVSTLVGRERIMQIYDHAIANKYRFFSFGDAMYLPNKRKQLPDYQITTKEPTQKLLLHVCCAICLSKAIDYAAKHYQLTLLFTNDNFLSLDEYNKRLEAVELFLNEYNLLNGTNIQLIALPYTPFEVDENLSSCPENGVRCLYCYKKRLETLAKYAKENNFKHFATTLTSSRHKSATSINNIGMLFEGYVCSDFSKSTGNSTEIITRLALYRQNFCGCRFSLRQ